jgi:hypothetical protein
MTITAAATTMYRVVEDAALLAGCVGVGATEGETADVGAGVLGDDGAEDGGVVDGVVVVDGCADAGLTPLAVSEYEGQYELDPP